MTTQTTPQKSSITGRLRTDLCNIVESSFDNVNPLLHVDKTSKQNFHVYYSIYLLLYTECEIVRQTTPESD